MRMSISKRELVSVIYALAMLCLFASLVRGPESQAQSGGSTRQVFNDFEEEKSKQPPRRPKSPRGKPKRPPQKDGRPQTVDKVGRPGSQLMIELNRDGMISMVSPKTVFRSGDQVRFHFKVNFTGYVAVINKGSSGKLRLVFPYEEVSNMVTPTASYNIPQGNRWYKFDDQPGQEHLTFIMSRKPITHLNQLTAAAHMDLEKLDTQARARGRDLDLTVEDNAGYVLTDEQALSQPLGFSVILVHR